MKRIPFDFGLFYNTMIGLLQREPDKETFLENDGFCEFWYIPKNDKEAEFFERSYRNLAEFLDNYDIVFSCSRCEYGRHIPLRDDLIDNILQIRIQQQKKLNERFPFPGGLFYYLMSGLLKREPDRMVRWGFDGFYEYWYKPKDNEEAKFLEKNARVLAGWLNNFDIMFSRSRCEYGKYVPLQDDDSGNILQIRIQQVMEK